MLYFDRIDVSEGTDVNKTNESKECDICHYWYFLNKGFKFQPNVYNGCHDSIKALRSLIRFKPVLSSLLIKNRYFASEAFFSI